MLLPNAVPVVAVSNGRSLDMRHAKTVGWEDELSEGLRRLRSSGSSMSLSRRVPATGLPGGNLLG